jgi:hypothetical protein
MAKPDLSKIKSEIESRKREKNMVQSPFGEKVGGNLAPRDTFLNGLIESLNTGRDTASSNLVKTVDNKAALRKGEVARHDVKPVAPVQQPVHRTEPIDMSPERDEQLFVDIERKRKQTLAESIEGFTGAQPRTNQGNYVDYNGQKLLTTPPATGGLSTINEGVLVENVKKIVNGYLSENLGPIFEEAIKDTIIEMYAVERIKEVLKENREMIKTVVIETIREIQQKNKAKAQ